jgi:hypothetical protein
MQIAPLLALEPLQPATGEIIPRVAEAVKISLFRGIVCSMAFRSVMARNSH